MRYEIFGALLSFLIVRHIILSGFPLSFENLKCIARHVRYAHSSSENSLNAFMWYKGHTFESKLFTFNILDRVGGGDSFGGGLIYALLTGKASQAAIEFAVAASALKQTIVGDFNLATLDEVKKLMGGDASGRVNR